MSSSILFPTYPQTIHDTLRAVDKDNFNKITEILSNANNIYIYGIGASAGIANDFRQRLTEIGFNAFFFSDIVNMRISTLNIKDGDVAVGISNSGRTSATVDALKNARKKGAETICITSCPKSEITKNSDYSIAIKTDEIQYPIEAISARIAHVSILDSIAVALSSRHYNEAVERAAEIHDLVENLRY